MRTPGRTKRHRRREPAGRPGPAASCPDVVTRTPARVAPSATPFQSMSERPMHLEPAHGTERRTDPGDGNGNAWRHHRVVRELPIDAALMGDVLVHCGATPSAPVPAGRSATAGRPRSTSTSTPFLAPKRLGTAPAPRRRPRPGPRRPGSGIATASRCVHAVVEVAPCRRDTCELTRPARRCAHAVVVGPDPGARLELAQAALDELAEELLWHATRARSSDVEPQSGRNRSSRNRRTTAAVRQHGRANLVADRRSSRPPPECRPAVTRTPPSGRPPRAMGRRRPRRHRWPHRLATC